MNYPSRGDGLSSTGGALSSDASHSQSQLHSTSQRAQQRLQQQQQQRVYHSRSDLGANPVDYHEILRTHYAQSQGSDSHLSSQAGNNHSDLHSAGNSDADGLSSSGAGGSSLRSGSVSGMSSSNSSNVGQHFSDSDPTSLENLEIRDGATVKPIETIKLFNHFFRNFRLGSDPDEDPFYVKYLDDILRSSTTIINLDLNHLHHYIYGDQLFEALVYFPTATIQIADFVLNQLADAMRAKYDASIEQRMQNEGRGGMGHSESDMRSDIMGLVSGGLGSEQHNFFNAYHNHPILLRPFGLTLLNSRSLQPHDIDGLVSIRGIVLRVGSIKPELKIATFLCNTQGCNFAITQEVTDGRVKQPTFCQTCQRRDTFTLAHNSSRFVSKQTIRIQEVPEDISDGETPHTVSIQIYDDLVDSVKPGDRIICTGIFRGQPIRLNSAKRAVKSSLFTYIDAFHFRMVSSASSSKTGDDNQINQDIGLGLDTAANKTDTQGTQLLAHKTTLTREDEDILIALGQRSDIYDVLARSIAPSVWGLEDVKKGLLTMLVGGNNLEGDQNDSEGGQGGDAADESSKKRGKRGVVHVLLVGDPGTAKSQLLQYIHKLSTRGVYTSGTASSAAGLTAAVMHDPVQNESVLEPGALVLSDCDICCIDEFDKMSGSAQSILHEAMEQQTVSIAKAGVICSLSARTTILASANPRDSRYNPALSIVQNIDLSPTLLSRFDLIYIILDTPNPQSDERLAEHLLSLFMSDEDREKFRDENTLKLEAKIGKPIKHSNVYGLDLTLPVSDSGEEYLPSQNLLQYINYARSIVPIFTDAACEELENAYLALRGSVSDAANADQTNDSILSSSIAGGNAGAETTISATPRQLQSLIRISEALAKIHLHDTISANDVREASRLIRTATLSAAIDPTTGKIDMSALNTGVSFSDRKLIQVCAHHIKLYLAANITKPHHTIPEIHQAISPINREFTEEVVGETVKQLHQEEVVDFCNGGTAVRVKHLN